MSCLWPNIHIKTLNSKINRLINDGVSVKKEEKPTGAKSFETAKDASPLPRTPITELPVSKPIEEGREEISKKTSESKKPEPLTVYNIKKETPVEYIIKKVKTPKKSLWEKFKEKNPDLEKFVGENLINKLGVLILVLGISYFVKYAIDKDWINEPARVGIGVLCGFVVMLIANKLRKKYAAFSSVLVAGAISIFYFTIAIAFHEYQLFNQ